MLVKWSVGGLSSAKRIDDIGVEFQLLNSASANFVDSQILHSASFVPKVNAVKLQADGVHVRQRGDARNVDAWDVIFFMRFAKKGGDGICPVARKCEAERAWRKGRVGNGGRGRLIAGLIVGGVAGVVIIAGCVCAVRRRGRRAEARLEEDEKEKGENMRDAESGSVVYDGKWKEWTEAGGKREQDDGIQNENEGRREYFALDLYKKGRDT